MKTRGPIFEKSRSVENVQHLRLTALLRELVKERGPKKAAEALDVDPRTLTSSLRGGRLSRRMWVALEKALLEGGGSPAAEQRERNDRLEKRLEAVEGRVEELSKELGRGFSTVQGDLKALKDGHGQRLARLEAGGITQDSGDEEGAGERTESKAKTRLRREFPDLATLEPADDDKEVFGDAWPLIVEWRELKGAHPNRGRGLDWLRMEERLLTVELALLEEHGMTLPPETYPLRDFARSGQVNWRRAALSDTRRARARWELPHRVARAVTLRLWRK